MYDPLDFLAEVTQHIPDKGEHQIRYYGWYSNKKRGMREDKKTVAVAGQAEPYMSAYEKSPFFAVCIKSPVTAILGFDNYTQNTYIFN